MKLYDVAIIGAGVTGTSIARELSRYRLKIALLEKEGRKVRTLASGRESGEWHLCRLRKQKGNR